MTIRMGVVGMGFMGQTHARAIRAAEGCVLAGVCDHQGDRRGGRATVAGNLDNGAGVDLSGAKAFDDAGALFASGEVDAVVIATPTDTHADLACKALAAGLDVLIEKPVALREAEIRRVMAARDAAGRLAVPAMCMRFWPGWPLLRECVRDRRYGGLRALRLVRLGSRPEWSAFYRDESRCGGAIFDLHVHDADFVLHLLGTPAAVSSAGSSDHVATLYRYADPGLVVTAEGGWMASAGRGFRMRYGAEFDEATVEFDLAHTPTVTITRGGETTSPALPAGSGYEAQMRHFVACAGARRAGGVVGTVPEHPTLEDALRVTALIEREKESLRSGASVAV